MQDRRGAAATAVTFGYHGSHEQHAPSKLLEYVRLAEQAGFTAAMCSDHFHPWIERQGQSGFTWSWLGAALQATRLTFGCVNAPGWRYHPAIIAQAVATLCEMYPERFWLAVGSGEALNEHITGERWPVKSERDERLIECVTVMRKLWAGETVTHHGRIVVEEAKLYTLPEAATGLRRGVERRDRRVDRLLGRWIDHGRRAGRKARRGVRRIPRRRRCRQAGESAGLPRMGADEGRSL